MRIGVGSSHADRADCRAPSGTPASSMVTARMGSGPEPLADPSSRGDTQEVAQTAMGRKKEEENQVD